MIKELKDIAWDIPEEDYRKDPALSYSTLAKYEREGFSNLDKLFDKIETPSLTFGSAVDAIITGGQKEFDERFMVAEFPSTPDSIIKVVRYTFNTYKDAYNSLDSIPNDYLVTMAQMCNYQPNWRPETRVKVIKEKGAEYYNLMYLAGDRTILDTTTYQDVCNAVDALKNSEATKWYFQSDNPFENVKRYYQLKFKATLNNVDYRCMMDLCVVDYDNKTIQPVDLKTSHKREYDFCKSFIEWNYQIQNRLYFRILQDNILNDDYFKDFKILPYKDIVVCRDSLIPLVWDCDFTFAKGTMTFGKDNQFIMRDPEDIGKELTYYLKHKPRVPLGINENGPNNLRKWLNEL